MGEQAAAQQAFALTIQSGLLRSEEQFRQFLDVLPAAAYMCDAEGLITYYNDHAVSMWGRNPQLNDPRDRFCGSFKLFTVDSKPMNHEECWMALALRFEREFNGEEIQIEREDGERLTALAHARPIRGEDGRLVGAVNVLIDITQRKQAESALAESHEELERRVEERTADLESLNRELESFNYSVSHDLRAPLRGIDGFSRLLEEEYESVLDEGGRGYLRRIRDGASRMGVLIEALLGFSSVARGELDKRKVDLAVSATLVMERLRAIAPERQVEFVCPPELPACGDERLLGIVLENLLENAWKFTAEMNRATVELGSSGFAGEKVYFVRDNGTGFDPRHADRLFVPFQRLHSSSRFKGTGIGLATVQRIVHRHGGKIWSEARLNAGATFYFTLPERLTDGPSRR